MSQGSSGPAGSDSKSAKAVLVAELEDLIARFERESLALPPSDAAIKQWSHQSLQIAQHIRHAGWHGKAGLLRRLQRFQWQLRQTRHASRRLRSDRLGWQSGYASAPPSMLAGIELAQHPLSHAIQNYINTPPPPAVEEELTVTAAAVEESADAEPEQPVVRPAPRPTAGRWRERPSTHRTSSHSTRADPVMALEGRLALPDSFERARDVAIKWLVRKGLRVPAGSEDGFELRSANNQNTAIAVAWGGIWALQVETADPTLKGRRWRVEMVLLQAQPTPGLGIRLTAISPADQPPPPVSVPGLVSDLIADVGLLDPAANEQLFADATVVDSVGALEKMLDWLQSPRRQRPVVVLSTYTKQDRPATFLDLGKLKGLRGLAKVYVLPREMSWRLTSALSKRFAVAGACVRLFRPGFSADDPPEHHPAWDPTSLRAQGMSLRDVEEFLFREAAEASLHAQDRQDALPPFDRIREKVLRRQIEEARAFAQKQVAAAGLHGEEIVLTLRKQLQDEESLRNMFEAESHELDQQLLHTLRERDDLREERDQLKALTFRLQSRLNALQQDGVATASVVVFPDTWDDLEAWCTAHLGEQVVVTPKAIRAARDSEYEDVAFAYQVLYFLASVYVPCRRGELPRERLDEEKARLRIEISNTGKGVEDRRFKEAYTTTYLNKRVVLDRHVKRGSDKNPKFNFRLYYHWHEDQRLIVGSFPTHLDNSLT